MFVLFAPAWLASRLQLCCRAAFLSFVCIRPCLAVACFSFVLLPRIFCFVRSCMLVLCSWPLLPAGLHFLSSQTRPAGLLVRSKHRAFFCPCHPCLHRLDLFPPMLVSRPPLLHPLWGPPWLLRRRLQPVRPVLLAAHVWPPGLSVRPSASTANWVRALPVQYYLSKVLKLSLVSVLQLLANSSHTIWPPLFVLPSLCFICLRCGFDWWVPRPPSGVNPHPLSRVFPYPRIATSWAGPFICLRAGFSIHLGVRGVEFDATVGCCRRPGCGLTAGAVPDLSPSSHSQSAMAGRVLWVPCGRRPLVSLDL